jgi:endonuclease YncB( thermonuclease family)
MTVWTVPATVQRVVDGDTLEVLLDLGWHLTLTTKVRLARCNAPEMDHGHSDGPVGPGRAAYVFTSNSLWNELGSSVEDGGSAGAFYPVTVVSHSLDKYGRVLGEVKWTDRAGVAHNLSDDLLASGHAVPM